MFNTSTPGGHTEIIQGVHLKTTVYGDQTLMTEIRLDKGAVIPAHSHPHEQTGYMLSGQMDFLVDGKHHLAKPGDSWSIAAGLEHGARALEESLLVEVFSPVREDYLPYYNANS